MHFSVVFSRSSIGILGFYYQYFVHKISKLLEHKSVSNAHLAKFSSLLQPLKLPCEVCSIVSSSGQMLGRETGPEIDQSSCIWRMNNAPTRDFERDVGHRTDLRVVSHTSVPLLIQKPQDFFGQGNKTVYVVWGPLRNMRQDGKGIVYNMLKQVVENYPNARIYVTTEERMNYCDTVFKKETGKDR